MNRFLDSPSPKSRPPTPQNISLIDILNTPSKQSKVKTLSSLNRDSDSSTTVDDLCELPVIETLKLKSNLPKLEKKTQPMALVQFQFSEKYKTEICKNFEQTKSCKFGDNCCFAHGESELRSKLVSNEFYKTKVCRHFEHVGFCPYGQRCQYFHFQNNRVFSEIWESIVSKAASNKLALNGNFDEFLTKTDNLFVKKTQSIGLF